MLNVKFKVPDWGKGRWKELDENPLIGYERARYAIGDPQVLTPGEHDEKWHIFYHGYFGDNILFFHHTSEDGIHWSEPVRWDDWIVGQNYIFSDGIQWIMYYTCDLRYKPEEKEKYGCDTIIRGKTTRDFETWSDEFDVILPESDMEREGRMIQARNPCMIHLPNGKYRLYYSAGTVWLDDLGYEEPKYIFYAESDSPYGPFRKENLPILSPDPGLKYRDLGCGAIKVFQYQNGYIGFYNPIYTSEDGASRSEIRMLASEDGINWEEAECNPIIIPTDGWKKAIVYQLDVVTWQDSLLMYYNARDEWYNGIERIGCSRLTLNGSPGLKKMRKLPVNP